jgi:antirestriction protein ArdC
MIANCDTSDISMLR